MNQNEGSISEMDRDLAIRVTSFLRQSSVPTLRRIAVEVRSGIVTLHGRVHTFYQRQLCLQCCQRVAGVIRLIDQIEVEPFEEPVVAV